MPIKQTGDNHWMTANCSQSLDEKVKPNMTNIKAFLDVSSGAYAAVLDVSFSPRRGILYFLQTKARKIEI